jgi:hypothetical protein
MELTVLVLVRLQRNKLVYGVVIKHLRPQTKSKVLMSETIKEQRS